MDVRFGTVGNVYGVPASRDGFTFLPADVSLAGSSFSLSFELAEYLDEPPPPVLRLPVKESFDAAWVRARIPNVFGFEPEAAGVEKALLFAGFVAVTPDRSTAYPFVCIDRYGRSALMFSDEGPEEEVKRSIAAAFWETLLDSPEELTDFEERVYHPGASIWLTYGCKFGHLYCDESQE
jgi:hypothetical protein